MWGNCSVTATCDSSFSTTIKTLTPFRNEKLIYSLARTNHIFCKKLALSHCVPTTTPHSEHSGTILNCLEFFLRF